MKHLYAFVVLALMFFSAGDVFATHQMGADIEYQCLGQFGGVMRYRVVYSFYRNCRETNGTNAIGAPNTVSLRAVPQNCAGQADVVVTMQRIQSQSGMEVSQLCPSQLSQSGCNFTAGQPAPFPGVQIYKYEATIDLPITCSGWLFRNTDCCRNSIINNIPNPGSAALSIQSFVNQGIDPATGQPYCNNSVTFTQQPVPFVCANSLVEYNHGAVDADGDSLVYTLINPLGASYNPINFSAGYSANQPIRTSPPNSFQFDQNTGQMTFTPAFQEVDVLAVRVDEYRDGVLIGSTIRDIQVSILVCNVSIPIQEPISNIVNGNQKDSITLEICPGTPVTFDIIVVDPNGRNLSLSSSLQSTPSPMPGATFSQIPVGTAPNDTAIARISWNPTAADTGCRQFLLIGENDDCPIRGRVAKVYNVCVFNKVQLLTASPTFCGKPVQLTATGGTNFTWDPVNSLSNANSLTPLASPTQNTWYKFTSDCGTDSVFVSVAQPFVYDAGVGGQICQNGQLQLNASVDNLYAPYSIKWIPSNGLIDPVFGLPNDTILNPVASPLVTTNYKVVFIANNGCVNEDSVLVTVSGTGPLVQAKTDKNIVCPGQPAQLTLISNPQSCGIAQQPCLGNDVNAQVGTSTAQSNNSPVQMPSPLGGYVKSSRHQLLYRASEILAAVPSGGKIKSISINLIQPGNTVPFTTLDNLTIRMACVQDDSLIGYIGGGSLATVYTPKNYTPVYGWNTFQLDNVYDWDGKSNLLIDICHNSAAGGNGQNMRYQITRTDGSQGFANYRSLWCTESQQFDQCGVTGSVPTLNAARYKERPNLRFVICVADFTNSNIAWTPSSGANAPTPINNDTTIARPQSPQIYNVAVTDQNGCTGNSFIFVNVDTSTVLRMSNDTFICAASATVNIRATVTSQVPNQTYTYTWAASPAAGFVNPGNVSNFNVTPSATTKYYVTVSGGSCVLGDSVTVSVGSRLPVSMNVTPIQCFGNNNAAINVAVTGNPSGLNYAWTPNTVSGGNPTGLSPGVYSVTVTDQQGCEGADTVIINQPAQLQLNISKLNVLCYGQTNGNITATVIGGTPPYNFNWSPTLPNTATPSNLGAGNYALTVTDNNGCSITGADSITQPPVFEVTVATTNANCPTSNDGTAVADVVGGAQPYASITWDGTIGTQTRNALSFGSHTVVVTDANQCTASETFFIDTNYALRVDVQTTDALCFGANNGTASVTPLNGTPNYNFQYFNAANQPANSNALVAGNYTVVTRDNLNCSVTSTFSIGQPTQVVLSITKTDPVCSGDDNGQASVSASGGSPGYTFVWSNGETTDAISNLSEGFFSVTATDQNSCTGTANVLLESPNKMTITFTDISQISCFGDRNAAVTVDVSGGTQPYGFAWSSIPLYQGLSGASLSGLDEGRYFITVSDANGCFISDSIRFVSPPALDFNFIITDSVSCPGFADGRIRFLGIGGTPIFNPTGYVYSIDNVTYQESNTFPNLVAADYRVYVKDDNGCVADSLVSVNSPLALGLNISPQDSLIELGAQVQLVALPVGSSSSQVRSFQWTPATGLSCVDCANPVASPFSDTEYELEVRYLTQCIVKSKVRVFVDEGKPFFVPNLISPNGDGVNDVWQVYGFDLKDVAVKIFNRWGEKVFDSGGNQFSGWDGTYKGVMQEPGIFTYFISAEYLNGKRTEKSGTITLVR